MARKTKTHTQSSGRTARKRKAKPARTSSNARPAWPVRWWRGLPEAARKSVARFAARAAVVLAVLGALAGGMLYLESRVRASQPAATFRKIRIAPAEGSVPDWMPSRLADSILYSVWPPDGRFVAEALTRRVAARALASPWVESLESVVKRRSPADPTIGVVEIRARYRRPYAQVRYRSAGRSRVYVVDRRGVLLPSEAGGPPPATGIVIEGVENPPPEHFGRAWPGEDVADALRLIRLVEGRPYFDQFVKVDVSNHDGRVNPYVSHMNLFAQLGRGPVTTFEFGQFPEPGRSDCVIPPEQKLASLDYIAAQNGGRVAGIESHDLRHDYVEAHLR